MVIKVRQNLVSPSKYNIKCPYSMQAETITVHNTLNKVSAEREVNYMIGNDNLTSFHYAVDGIECVQGILTSRNSWHAGDSKYGDGNRKSISVEICYSTGTDEQYAKAEDMAVKFIAQLLHERNWKVDRVRDHKSWTEIGVKKGWSRYVKNCPHRILDDGRWTSFIAEIQKELDLLNAPAVTPVSNPIAANVYVVAKGDTLYGIAVKHKMTVASIKALNGLKSDFLEIGQKLTFVARVVAKPTAPVVAKPVVAKPTSPVKTVAPTVIKPATPVNGKIHTVVNGDTLWELSVRYKTTVVNLKKWNALKTDVLSVGQKLKVAAPVVPAKYHTVKSGDTLSEIALKYKTTVAKIDALNRTVKNINKISIGQKIRVA